MKFYTIPNTKIVFTLRPNKKPTSTLIELKEDQVLDFLIDNNCLWVYRSLIDDQYSIVLNKFDSDHSVLRHEVLGLCKKDKITYEQKPITLISNNLKCKNKAQVIKTLLNVENSTGYVKSFLKEFVKNGQATLEKKGSSAIYHLNDGSDFKMAAIW